MAGIQHHDVDSVREQLRELAPLQLRPEPENEYDPNAVGVYYEGHKLGFVAKTVAARISALLRGGAPYSAVISQIDWSAQPYHQVHMVVAVRTPDVEGEGVTE